MRGAAGEIGGHRGSMAAGWKDVSSQQILLKPRSTIFSYFLLENYF